MARRPEPWWWKERQAWFVTIDGARHSLGQDDDDARQRFHELMAEPRKRRVSSNSVVAICDAYVDWVQEHRPPDSYRWYKDRLQRFVENIPPALRVTQLRPFHVQQFIDGLDLSSGTKRNFVRAVGCGNGLCLVRFRGGNAPFNSASGRLPAFAGRSRRHSMGWPLDRPLGMGAGRRPSPRPRGSTGSLCGAGVAGFPATVRGTLH